MIKRTLYFENRAYLSTNNQQLIISRGEKIEPVSIPIEDIGILILDHPQITITQTLIARLLANNVALITCNSSHLPTGLMLNLDGHTLQSQRFKAQINASEPLKKQLWQQTIIAKINNQAAVLDNEGIPYEFLLNLSKKVKSGDSTNCEAAAANYYWKNIFSKHLNFYRQREGMPPNNLLNYGYAILRAIVARNLVGSGLLPTLGIFHRNQYNAYCLADDIMEPYRPYVDSVVCDIIKEHADYKTLSVAIKARLLGIALTDVRIDKSQSPLMIACQRTTVSLAKCFEGTIKKIVYPEI